MALIDHLSGNLIGLDTSILIYYIAGDSGYATIIAPLFDEIASGNLIGVTSTVSLVEALVHPLRNNDVEMVRLTKEMLLESDNVLTFELTAEIAERAAMLRAQHNLRTPDAIQLATALYAGAQTFVTNYRRLRSIDGLKVVVLQDLIEMEDW